MEIKEFGQVIAREVKDALGDCYTIDYSDVLKNNGVVYHALTIRKKDEKVAPTIYIDGMYEQYRRGALLMGIVNDVWTFILSVEDWAVRAYPFPSLLKINLNVGVRLNEMGTLTYRTVPFGVLSDQ